MRNWIFQTGSAFRAICLILALIAAFSCELWQPANAFLGFPRKKTEPAKNLPPSAQVSPSLLRPPGQTSSPGQSPARPGTWSSSQPAVIISPVTTLVQKGVFPAEAASRTTPLTRAYWADILVKALGHPTSQVSEFPFYRDVKQDYWAYNAIEVARSKKLIEYPQNHGNYEPEKSVTYGEVYLALANAITTPLPPLEAKDSMLQGFSDRDRISGDLLPAVMKLSRAGFFAPPRQRTGRPMTGVDSTQKKTLKADDSVTPDGLAPLVVFLMRMTELRTPLLQNESLGVVVPAGLKLKISPAVAIVEAQLTLDRRVYFTLITPVDLLTKGSYIKGTIKEILANRDYRVEFYEAQTPEGDKYQISGSIVLRFSSKSKLDFLVPGQVFELTTTQSKPPLIQINPSGSEKPLMQSKGAAPAGQPRIVPAMAPAAPVKPAIK